MATSIIMFNTSGIENDNTLHIMELAGINANTDFDQEIAQSSEGAKKLLELAKIYYARKGDSIEFNREMVKPANQEYKTVANIPAASAIKFVFDDFHKEWSIVTLSDGKRFQKKISELTIADANLPGLAGINIPEVKDLLESRKTYLDFTQWSNLKAKSFDHPNPIQEISELLRADLDFPKTAGGAPLTKDIRDYLKARIQKTHDTVLVLFSNETGHNRAQEFCGPKELAYIDNIIKQVDENQRIKAFYLGAGHGWPKNETDRFLRNNGQIAGIQTAAVMKIYNTLKQKNISAYSIIFGSCFSASFVNDFSNLLTDEGVILSNTVSQGGNNYFNKTMDVVTGKESPDQFFKDEDSNQPTGLCLSTKNNGHSGLIINRMETGVPEGMHDDEIARSNKIISDFQRTSKDSSHFSGNVKEVNTGSQHTLFNGLLTASFMQLDLEENPVVANEADLEFDVPEIDAKQLAKSDKLPGNLAANIGLFKVPAEVKNKVKQPVVEEDVQPENTVKITGS